MINVEQLMNDLKIAEDRLRQSAKRYLEMRDLEEPDSTQWNYLHGEVVGKLDGAVKIACILEKYK